MVNNIFRKSLVIGIIVLFVGASVFPSIGANFQNQKKDINLKKININEKIKEQSILDGPSWIWAKSAGGILNDEGYRITLDGNGNAYITGLFCDSIKFGSIILNSQGSCDVFVAKIDANGDWQWAKSAGGINVDEGTGVAVDGNGNTYITGCFSGSATFGNTTLTSQGYNDVFVAKLDTNGNWQWAKGAEGTLYDFGAGISVDVNGDIYIIGFFDSSVKFGSITLHSLGDFDVFIAKLDTNDNWQWAKSAGGTNWDTGYGVALDGNGNTYITGFFQGTATFGGTGLNSQGNKDMFIAKLNKNGVWQWAKSAGGTGDDEGCGIALDGNGNTYVTGCFSGSAKFGSTTLTSQGKSDIFVAKIDSNGVWQWAKGAGGIYSDVGFGIAVNVNGNTYITGFFQGTTTFGSTILISQGNSDIFVAKLDTNGGWQWAKSAGGINDDEGHGITVDGKSNIYITGHFEDTVTFGSTTLNSQGNYDVFVAKLSGNSPPNKPTINGPNSGKPGISYDYTFNAVDPDNNNVKYIIDWGDGKTNTTNLYPSGTDVKVSHTWNSRGIYSIKAYAQDEYGLNGNIATFSITMPRIKALYNFNWLSFLERFSNIFPVLQKLLNRIGQ